MLYVLICDGTNKVKRVTSKYKVKSIWWDQGENVRLISNLMGLAYWALGPHSDRGRPTHYGWQAPVTLHHIKRWVRRLAVRGSPRAVLPPTNPNLIPRGCSQWREEPPLPRPTPRRPLHRPLLPVHRTIPTNQWWPDRAPPEAMVSLFLSSSLFLL